MEFINPYVFVIAVSSIIILSYIFSGIARKTNIPSVLLLVALGVGVAELIKTVDLQTSEGLFRILEIVGIIGLIMIVLEAALDLKLTKERKPMIIRSILVSSMGLVATSFGIAFLLNSVLHLGMYTSLVYAIPLAVLSSAIVIPSVTRLAQGKKEFLVYESTFSDILGILFFDLVIDNAAGGTVVSISLEIVLNLGVSILLALVISYALVYLLERSQNQVKLFFLIAILVLLYDVGKMLHLSALVVILVFGLVINNEQVFFRGRLKRWIKRHTLHTVVENFHVVTLETAFVVRTFFFVIFGMTLNLSSLFNVQVALLSLGILGIIYALRWICLVGSGMKGIVPEVFVAPRGLITLLLFFAIPSELQSTAFDSGIVLFTILGTSVIMMFGLIAYGKEGTWVAELSFKDWGALDNEIAELKRKNEKRLSGEPISLP